MLGRALVRWPDARAELRQARVARRFDMMLFGCHASFGQLGQRRGQLEFICDDAAKLPYAAALAPLSIAYIVAKGALEAQGRGGRKGTANFLQRAPIYPPGLILPDLQILSTGLRGSRARLRHITLVCPGDFCQGRISTEPSSGIRRTTSWRHKCALGYRLLSLALNYLLC